MYRQSLTIAEELAAAQPGNLDAQRDVSVSLNNVAGILKTSEPGAALELYRQSLTIAEELAAAQPGNLDAQRDEYVSHLLIGIFLSDTDAHSEARGHFGRACELMRAADATGWLPQADRRYMDFACQQGDSMAGRDRVGAASSEAESNRHGDEVPPNIADLVRSWLETETWDDSFAILAANRDSLATQAGLDQVLAQATGATAAIHATMLQMVAAGMPFAFIESLVTDSDFAMAEGVKALAASQLQLAEQILRVSDALMHSPRGPAMQIAYLLAGDQPDTARQVCSAVVEDNVDIAKAVAHELDSIAAQIASVGTALPDHDTYTQLLRTPQG
jgi:hypothetical protein